VKLTWHRQNLRLRHRFATSQYGVDEKETIVVELEHEGVTGYGEVAPSRLYGQTLESSEAALSGCARLLGDDPFALDTILRRLLDTWDGQRAAIAGVDSALHDWIAKRLGVPVWRLLGLKRPSVMTTMTIGVADADETRTKVDEALAAGFRALKVKVGTDDDLRTLEIVRAAFNGPLLLDANQGWDPADAARRIRELAQYRPAMIEQPLRRDDWRHLAELREIDVAPIYADESCERVADVVKLKDVVDGINIKFTKCGGIRAALEMIAVARALGLGVMLGCFACSGLAIAPALAIASLVDFVDLDGHLLLSDDPFPGIACREGIETLPDTAGLGVRPA